MSGTGYLVAKVNRAPNLNMIKQIEKETSD